MEPDDKDQIADETVEEVSQLYVRHAQRTGRVQRAANHVTAVLARPAALLTIFILTLAWVVGNRVARDLGWHGLEDPPFPDLELVATVSALLVALLILSTQRHEGELAERRAQLTLHLAALSERKIAKVIALLEEQRRDNPMLPPHDDREALDMARPTDPHAALDRLDEVGDAARDGRARLL